MLKQRKNVRLNGQIPTSSRETGDGSKSVEECPSAFLSTALSLLLFSFFSLSFLLWLSHALASPFSWCCFTNSNEAFVDLHGEHFEWPQCACLKKT